MTITASLLDDTYSANDATGRKRIYLTCSLTNPYTAGGETLDLSSYFKNKFFGGSVVAVSAAVSAALAGIARTGTLRGDASSAGSTAANIKLGFFQTGLSGTASAGLWVDNTTANLSTTTFTLSAEGY